MENKKTRYYFIFAGGVLLIIFATVSFILKIEHAKSIPYPNYSSIYSLFVVQIIGGLSFLTMSLLGIFKYTIK